MLEYLSAILDWCKVAVTLRQKNSQILFKEGEVWWCSIGMNIGVEIFGKGPKFTRPVLVIKKFDSASFLGVPLTTSLNEGDWRIPIVIGGKEGRVILDQIRTFDSKRLTKRIETLYQEDLDKIKTTLTELCGPQNVVIPPAQEETEGIGG